jgi:hypothetical protein
LILKNQEDQCLSNVRYTLEIDGMIIDGQTDSSGVIQEEIAARDERGQLTIFPNDPNDDVFSCNVQLGHLDPVHELSGIQARLNNLGFHAGPVDGIDGPLTQDAIKAFQERQGLVVDGIAGPQTQARLKVAHYC